jgi:anti-sigma regulatory factor (Ser/Thr protein kinase)
MMDTTMTVRLNNQNPDHDLVVDRFSEFANFHRLPRRVLNFMHVAMDEVVSNVLKFAWDDQRSHDIDLHIRLIDTTVEMEIVDDGKPFNMLEYEDPVVGQSLEEKEVGGLGIYLVKKLMSSQDYKRLGDRNHLTLRMRF